MSLSQSIESTFLTAEKVFGRKFERVKIDTVRRDATRAADAWFHPVRQIRINPTIAAWYPQLMRNVILPHEVAHLISYDLYGQKAWGHGPLWKRTMVQLGQKPNTLNNYLSERDMNKVVYQCGCSRQTMIPRIQHRRIANGYSVLRCSRCGNKMEFEGLVFELVKKKALTCRDMPEII